MNKTKKRKIDIEDLTYKIAEFLGLILIILGGFSMILGLMGIIKMNIEALFS